MTVRLLVHYEKRLECRSAGRLIGAIDLEHAGGMATQERRSLAQHRHFINITYWVEQEVGIKVATPQNE